MRFPSYIHGVPLAALVASALFNPMAMADNTIHLSGFGTLAINHSNRSGADWTSTTEEYSGVGKTVLTSAGPDSDFGVQLDHQALPWLHETIQIVSRQLSNNTSTPYFEWANIQIKMNPEWTMRLGRLANNTFLYSDSRDIGYDRPMIHLPDLYMLNPTANINGGDLTYRTSLGNWTVHVNGNVGVFNQYYLNQTIGAHVRSSGFNIGAEYGNHAFRLSEAQGHIDLNNAKLNAYHVDLAIDSQAIAPFSQTWSAQAQNAFQQTQLNEIPASFMDASYTYDNGDQFVTMEWARRQIGSDVDIPSQQGLYVQAGQRTGRLTYYGQWGMTRTETNAYITQIGGPTNNTLTMGLNGASASFSGSYNQSTTTAGLRWDIQNNLDLKIQDDYINKPAHSYGLFVGGGSTSGVPTVFFTQSRHINIISAALDFVF